MEIHNVEIDNKKVFISQRGDNFKVVKPLKNEDGSWNWFNICTGGSWMNILIVGVVVIVVLGLLNEYSTNIKMLQEAANMCQQIILP